MTNIFQSLLLVNAGATQKELARQVKYLKVEIEILRSKLPHRGHPEGAEPAGSLPAGQVADRRKLFETVGEGRVG